MTDFLLALDFIGEKWPFLEFPWFQLYLGAYSDFMSKSGESWVHCKFVVTFVMVKVLILVFKVFSTNQLKRLNRSCEIVYL